MNRLALILLLVVPINIFAQREFEFIGESIDFAINSERFEINGIYYFLNNSEQEIRRTILFPFARNTDSVVVKRIYNLTYLRNIDYQQLENAVAFSLIAQPKDTVKVNIAYSQNSVRENIYILETTQMWGQALKKAEYSLTFDTSVQIDSLSLKPDSLSNNVYYWKREDFYPNENFKVWISP
ncbi:MAG TPA: hypothetical protein PKW37_05155 [Salinivirgaceae bacterium]|nr:hypothetical protein [Salinivirgaceae bacterium]